MATGSCPTLPNELWLKVLEKLQQEEDLPDLWTSARHVCTTFKQSVEAIMRENHLPKTSIFVDLSEPRDIDDNDEENEDEDERMPYELEFEFSHLSDDKSKAIFMPKDIHEDHQAEILKRLRKCLEHRKIEDSKFDITIHQDVNDGPIPDLSIDDDNLQLSCDWRGTFTVFYGEEQIYHNMLSQWTKKQEQWTIGLREKMERGELDLGEMMQQVLGGFASASDEARKNARRTRIRREYERLPGNHADVDHSVDMIQEEKALERLKQARFIRGFPTDSDDELEEVEDEEEEEDEWEDDDSSDANSDAQSV